MSGFLELKIDKFIFKVAEDRFYNHEGVWVMQQDQFIRLGLSDFLQQRSGDIAFADVKPADTMLTTGSEVATIETIKVNIDVSSPVNGKIIRINPLMEISPEIMNIDPYGEGWLCEIEPLDWEADKKNLLNAAAYFAQIKLQAEAEVNKNG